MSLILIILFISPLASQVVFEKKYGGSLDEIGFASCVVESGGYATFGWSKSYGNGMADYYLVRSDADGNVIWTKSFGGSQSDSGLSLEATTDGGFILGGTSRTYGAGAGDCWLIKTDANGNVEWQKTYGSSQDDYLRNVKQTADGGYIFVGMTNSSGSEGTDVLLVKTDNLGVQTWSKTFGGANNDEGWSVDITSDGAYIVGGWTESFGNGLADFYLIKTDADGVEIWNKTYGGTASDSGISVLQTSDEGYIFSGTTRSFGAGAADVWLIKTNSVGDTLWTKTYGGALDDYGRAVCQRTSGYAISGYTKSSGAGESDLYVVLTDDSGNLTNEYKLGGSNADEGWGIYSTGNDLLVTGQTASNSSGMSDMYFIKIHDMLSSVETVPGKPSFVLYPNPVSNLLFVKMMGTDLPVLSVIYDSRGRKIDVDRTMLIEGSGWDISELNAGIYWAEFLFGDERSCQKFVKE